MQNLQEILKGVVVLSSKGSLDIAVGRVEFDSRRVGPGDLFVAVRGTLTDGHRYIDKAVATGDAAIICEEIPHFISIVQTA